MGNYFVMSKRFDKCCASDFGLIQKDSNTAIRPDDNSIWAKVFLYDFGWGKENGFYKIPLPDFDTLMELVLYSDNSDDMYGASAIISEEYADELLCQCEIISKDKQKKKEFKKLIVVFKLKDPINRCPVVGRTFERIQSDFERWKCISEIAAWI